MECANFYIIFFEVELVIEAFDKVLIVPSDDVQVLTEEVVSIAWHD